MINYKKINQIQLKVFIFVYACFLFLNAPRTVQGTDTGELVTNAFFFRVIHPPGYPLYTWLYGFFINFVHISSPFFSAVILTIIFSILCIIILSKNITWPLFLIFVTTPLFFKYSIMPDVFILHILLSTLVIYFYKKGRHLLSILFFSLGCCHHLTIIFLSPLILDILITNRKKLIYFLIPTLLVPVLYLSLFLLDTKSMTSWGQLSGIKSLFEHFLRKDYGTHKLAITEYHNYFFNYCLSFIERWYGLIIVSILVVISNWKRIRIKNSKENIYILLSLTLYVLVFFNMATVLPDQMGKEIIDRFLLMPALLLIFLISGYVNTSVISSRDKKAISFCVAFLCLLNMYINISNLNYSKDNRIENWAKDRLEAVPQKTIILESSDVGLFSLYYVQNVLNIRKDVLVFSPKLLFNQWYFNKVSDNLPKLKLDKNKILKEKKYDFEKDLIAPNVINFKFHVRRNFTNDKNFKITYDLVGRLIESGSGTFYVPDVRKLASPIEPKSSSSFFALNYDSGDDYGSDYCIYHLSKAMNYYRNNEYELFYNELLAGIKKVNFCLPAYNLLCDSKFHQDEFCKLKEKYLSYGIYY